MKAGELRHRVTIQEYVADRDDFGGEVKIWVDLATVWAAIEPAGGDEGFQTAADQNLARRQTKIRIRQRDGLDQAKLRLVFGERIFDVQAVEIDPTLKRQMILTCEEMNA